MLKRFFIMCSGADTDILENCTNGEQNKFAGIGATVFFTALMATLAGSYALYTVFDNYYIAAIFGLVWGLLIFNLDRFIVSTLKKKDRFMDEVIQASPRIILAVLIAIVISKPLELKIFEKEIDQVLLTQKNQLTQDNKSQLAAQFIPDITAIDSTISGLKQDVLKKEKEVNALYDTYIAEAEGRQGTKLLGKGPVYKEKREKHDAALAELSILKQESQIKIKDLESQKEIIKTNYQTAITNSQPIIDNFDGLMARIQALDTLPWLPSFFIFLLFLAVETAPIFAKLFSSKSEYDFKVQEIEQHIKSKITQHSYQLDLLSETDTTLNSKVYEDLKEDQEIYNHKKKIAAEILQRQQDNFRKKQWDLSS